MRMLVAVLFAATAAAASAADVDWDRYVRSDAIVRAHVVHKYGLESTTIDVEAIFLGVLPVGELEVWESSPGLSEGEEYILFLEHQSMRSTPPFFNVIDRQFARPDFEEVLRQAIAGMPHWSPRGSVSVISYTGRTEIGIDPALPRQEIEITIGYRNETDRRMELPGFSLYPHLPRLRKVSAWVKPPLERKE